MFFKVQLFFFDRNEKFLTKKKLKQSTMAKNKIYILKALLLVLLLSSFNLLEATQMRNYRNVNQYQQQRVNNRCENRAIASGIGGVLGAIANGVAVAAVQSAALAEAELAAANVGAELGLQVRMLGGLSGIIVGAIIGGVVGAIAGIGIAALTE